MLERHVDNPSKPPFSKGGFEIRAVGGSLQTVNNLLFFMSNIWLIVAREFNERVRKKSFIVTTLLMPVLMLGLMLAPALMMRYASGQTKTIVVIDRSGLVAQHLESSDEVRFETSDLPVDTALRVMIDKFGVLCIGADVLTNPSDVKLYANSASSMMLEENLRGQIAKVLEREKLRAYRIEDLDRILADVKTDVKMQVVRNDEGSPSSGSSAVAAMVGLGLGMVLYMFLMIYGAMVMQSVIEEKSSRVLEVVVSSVRPFELMMGKIFGVASVAVVQVLIWAVLVCGAGAAVMPHVLPDGAMEAAAALQQGGGAATAAAGSPWLPTWVIWRCCSATCCSSSWAVICSIRRCSRPSGRRSTTHRMPRSCRRRS